MVERSRDDLCEPWIGVFAIPEKLNIEVTESDLDSNPIIPRYIQIWQSKEMSHDFVRGQFVAETCFCHWG